MSVMSNFRFIIWSYIYGLMLIGIYTFSTSVIGPYLHEMSSLVGAQNLTWLGLSALWTLMGSLALTIARKIDAR